MMKKIIYIILVLTVSTAQAQKFDLGNNHQPIRTVRFSPDSKLLIAGGFLKIYEMNSGSAVFGSSSAQDMVTSNLVLDADISNNGRYFAMLKMGRIEIFDIKARMPAARINAMKMSCASIAPDNRTLVYGKTNGEIAFYDIPAKREISKHKLGNMSPIRIDWSDSGKYIAIGGTGNTILIYDFEEKEIASSSKMSSKKTWDLEFSPDSRLLAAAFKNGNISLIDTESWETVSSWKAHTGDAFSLAFHPEGKYLVSGGADKTVRIWEVPSGTALRSINAHNKMVLAVDFSDDGTMIASGSMNGPLAGEHDTKVWNASDYGLPAITAEARLQGESPGTEDPGEGGDLLSKEQSMQSKTGDPGPENQAASDKQADYVRPESKNLQATGPAEQKRLALIIGNGIYQHGGILNNPENDANDIGNKLQTLGFDVMLFNNLDQKSFKKAIDDFGVRLEEYDVGLFYYAGHGVQVKGYNYLIPVDANLKSENDVEYDCVNAGRLLAKMEDAGSTTNIIILDACRDNPFERSWRRSAQGGGLAFMTAPAGSLISYATSPGATASDGSGRNGLFTTALLEYIDESGISILEMFQKVRTFVRENSSGEQVPWESTSLEGNFYFQ